MAMTFIIVRSPSAGWTISAASTPSKAPASIIITLPPPPSSAGVPRMTIRPPTSSATAAAASPAPRPAAAMTLWPQAWPMPGRASYSQHDRDGGPGVAGPGGEGGVEPVGVAVERQPLVLDQRR